MAADEFTLTRAGASAGGRPARSGKSLARTADRAGSFASKEIRAFLARSNEAASVPEWPSLISQPRVDRDAGGAEGQIGGEYGILIQICAPALPDEPRLRCSSHVEIVLKRS
jgi:hypothetical protein